MALLSASIKDMIFTRAVKKRSIETRCTSRQTKEALLSITPFFLCAFSREKFYREFRELQTLTNTNTMHKLHKLA